MISLMSAPFCTMRNDVLLEWSCAIKVSHDSESPVRSSVARCQCITVCVNNGILDIETVYNMGGPFMIEMYKKLEDIIRYKRKKDQREGIYEEFEEMVKSLQKINHKRLRRGK